LYQELQRKKSDLQSRKPYDLKTAVALRELDQLDHVCNALMLSGAEYSREEIRGMIDGEMPKTASLKDCLFVRNYVELIDVIQDSISIKCSLDSKLLLKFHNILAGQVKGFRRINQAIAEFRHVPPNHSEIEAKLNQLFKTVYENDFNEIRNASLIHYGILSIYPFEEYSEIIARLAMNYYLQEKGYLPVALGYNHKEYVSTMIECLKDGNDALFYWGLERAEFNKLTQVLQIIETIGE